MDEQISNGEIFRLCQRLEAKVDKINGSVGTHETRISLLEQTDKNQADWTARYGMVGGILAGIGYAVSQWFWSRG